MKLSIDLWLQNLIKAWETRESGGASWAGLFSYLPTSAPLGGALQELQELVHNLCYQLPRLQVTLAFCDFFFFLTRYWNDIKLWPCSCDEGTHWGLALVERFAYHKSSVWQRFEVIKDHWILVTPIPKKTMFVGAWPGSQRGGWNISRWKSKNLYYLKKDGKSKVSHKSSLENIERKISSVMCTDIIFSEFL